MTDPEIYREVYEFAANAHDKRFLKAESRFRKGTGIPYITHPVAVKDMAINRANDYYPPTSEKIFLISLVALLHDVLEDTNVTQRELEQFLIDLFLGSSFSLASAGSVFDAVLLLTKDKENFNIITYLNKIRANPFATIVKLCDLDHNMSDLKPSNLLDKYRLCHYFLTQ